MVIAGAVQPKPSGLVIEVPADPKVNRLAEAGTKSFFQQVKEKVVWVWDTTVLTFKVAGGKVAFVFFRALEIVSPKLALRLENSYLYVCDMIQAVKNARREKEIREEIERLRSQNRDLNIQVRYLGRIEEENGRITQERNRLQQELHLVADGRRALEGINLGLAQQVEMLQQGHGLMVRQGEAVETDRQALIGERNLLAERNNVLVQENGELKQARDQAIAAQEQANLAAERLGAEIPALRQRLQQAQAQAALNQQLLKVEEKAGQVQMRPDRQKTQIDDEVEVLLPALLASIETARQDIGNTVPCFSESPALQGRLNNIDSHLGQITDMMNKVPTAFRLHSLWQNPLIIGRA